MMDDLSAPRARHDGKLLAVLEPAKLRVWVAIGRASQGDVLTGREGHVALVGVDLGSFYIRMIKVGYKAVRHRLQLTLGSF